MADEVDRRPCPLCGEPIELPDEYAELPEVCPHCSGSLAEDVSAPADSPPAVGAPSGMTGMFCAMATEMGFLNEGQVTEALAAFRQAKHSGTGEKLVDVLVSRQYMSKAQCLRVRDRLRETGARVQVGPYKIVRKLGQGGMGAVYLAESPEYGAVALKILPRELASSKEFLGRFKRESSLVKQLDNPNVVKFYDEGEVKGNHYIAMEYVDGESVAARMVRRGLISEMRTLRIARDVAHALISAADLGIVHRDIKPANILLTRDGAAKLADLGLSKRPGAEFEASLTQVGIRVGTPAYMSPEQCLGQKDLDVRTDIYSLGATMYRMVTGRPPFMAANQVQVLHMHLREAPAPPIELNNKITRRLNKIILKMLEKSREDRFASAQELYDYLDQLITRREQRLAELHEARAAAATARREIEERMAEVGAPDQAARPTEAPARPRPLEPAPVFAADEAESSDELPSVSDDDTDTGEIAALGGDEMLSAEIPVLRQPANMADLETAVTPMPFVAQGGGWPRRKVVVLTVIALAVCVGCAIAIYYLLK